MNFYVGFDEPPPTFVQATYIVQPKDYSVEIAASGHDLFKFNLNIMRYQICFKSSVLIYLLKSIESVKIHIDILSKTAHILL